MAGPLHSQTSAFEHSFLFELAAQVSNHFFLHYLFSDSFLPGKLGLWPGYQ